MTETVPSPDEADARILARARAMVEHDPVLLHTLAETWWVALRQGIRVGINRVHDRAAGSDAMPLPECPFRPVGAVPLEPAADR